MITVRRLFLILFASVLFTFKISAVFPSSSNASAPSSETEAVCLNSSCSVTLNGTPISKVLLDDNEASYTTVPAKSTIIVKSDLPIAGVYVKFDRTPSSWKILQDDRALDCGKFGFLHEYVSLSDASDSLSLVFDSNTAIADIYFFSSGELPSWIQIWQPCEGRADLLMLPTHSDDDQLFFAGMIPYALSQGASVQVAYLVNHWDTHNRPHELLNGLWTAGLTRYPVIGALPDYWSDSLDSALISFAMAGYSYDNVVEMQTELIRRFQPQVVATHAENGEYGHGAHRLDCAASRDAVLAASDVTKYPKSAAQYGIWDVPKTYIHLYQPGEILLDLDTPLEEFGGKTAFEISQIAFRCHRSQHIWSSLMDFLYGTADAPITKASQIVNNSPCRFGLWRSTVGPDEAQNLFDHITCYAEQERLEEEQRRREEAERLEEQRRQEESRLEEESRAAEQSRLESIQKAEESTARATESSAQQNSAPAHNSWSMRYIGIACIIGLAVAFLAAIIFLKYKKQ